MIVKNEAARLKSCLESARLIASQLIVVDTGSDDQSSQIAADCGAEVYHHPWEGSFAKARNLSLDYATEDWVLILDGDEVLDEASLCALTELDLSNPYLEALNFQVVNFTTDRALITEAGIIDQVRLFRNQPQHRYDGLVHNQLINTVEGRPLEAINTTIRVLHYGYTPTVWAAQNKDARIEMHERAVAEDPENHFIRYNYGNHLKILRRYDEALEQFSLAVPPMSHFEGLSSEELSRSAEMIWGTSACFLGAFCANKLKRYEIALHLTEEALVRRPHLADAKLRRVEALMGLERYVEAIDLATSALIDDHIEMVKQKSINFDLPYRLGRALFLSGHRKQAGPPFASIIPHCDDITVFTHLCLSAISLGSPALWRYARERGGSLDPNDQDWLIVDQLITGAELSIKPLILHQIIYVEAQDEELASTWSSHLDKGLKKLDQYRRAEEPPLQISLRAHSELTGLALCLKITHDFAHLALIEKDPQKGQNLLYRCPERYLSPDLASPIESATLLISQLSVLS